MSTPATASATSEAEKPLVGEMPTRSCASRQKPSQPGHLARMVGAVSWYATKPAAHGTTIRHRDGACAEVS